MRKLLVICHGFPPYYGGAEHAAWYLARAAAATGRFEVSVLTSDIGGRLPAEEQMERLSVFRVPARKKEWSCHTVPELLSFLRSASARLAEILARTAPDHVLAHFALPAGELARRSGVPYSVVLHGADVPGQHTARFGPLYPLVRPLVRRVWRSAARVIAVSDELRRLALESWAGGDIEVIRNGVDTEMFRPRNPATEPRPDGEVRAVVVAQLIERKGLHFLFDALSLLAPAVRRRFSITICGVGPLEAPLRAQARGLGLEDRVVFKGLVPHEHLPAILRDSDVFILPSLREGLPLALLEAMGCGLAVVATRVGGIPAVLRDGENARVVDPGDSRQLRAALESLLDAGLRSRLAPEARQTAEAHSWSTAWSRYEACLGLA